MPKRRAACPGYVIVEGMRCSYCGCVWNALLPERAIGIQCPECKIYDPVAPIPGSVPTDGASLPHVTRQPAVIFTGVLQGNLHKEN